jgi:peroxiredoxin Q/BCP
VPPLAKKLGAWQEKSMYGKTYMGIARITYLVGPGGIVLQRWDKVKPEEHAAEVLEAIRAAK